MVCPICGAAAATLPAVDAPPMVGPVAAEGTATGGDPALPRVKDYEVLGKLGGGGMGIVYKARDVTLKRLVALKMMREGAFAEPELHARFRREAEAVARLQHPNIVQVYDFGEHQGQPYFTMEFIDGSDLDRFLAVGPLPPRAAAALVQVLARAMHTVHEQHVIHRDLKPANVLLARSNRPEALLLRELAVDRYEPRITDFGLARRLDQKLSRTGAIMGTPPYMSPEQATGDSKIDSATDVYALGAILYECLTGRPPFQAATIEETLLQVITREPVPPRQLNPAVDRDLNTITLKCLEKERGRRYASALELTDDLNRFLDDRPIVARPASALDQFSKFARRNRALVGGVVAVFLTLVCGIIGTSVAMWQARKAEREARQLQGEAETREEKVSQLLAEVKAQEQKERRLLAASYEDAGRLAMQRGTWRTALASFDKALEAGQADSPELHLNKVKAWCALDEVGKAVRELEVLAGRKDLGKLEGTVLLWRADLALCLSWARDEDKNLKLVEQALQKGLGPAETAYARGLLAKTSPEALGHLQEAVREDPFHQRANGMLAQLLMLLGRFEEARARVRFAELIFPDDPTFKVLPAEIKVLDENDLAGANLLLEQARGPLNERQMAMTRAYLELLSQVRDLGEANLVKGNLDLFSGWVKIFEALGKLFANEQQAGAAAGDQPRAASSVLIGPMPPVLLKAMRRLEPLSLRFLAALALGPWGPWGPVIQEFTEIIQIHPDGLLYWTLGVVLQLNDRWAEAEMAYLTAGSTWSVVPVRQPALRGAIECEFALGGGMKSKQAAAGRNEVFAVQGHLSALFACSPAPIQMLPGLYLGSLEPKRRAVQNLRKLVQLGPIPLDSLGLVVVAEQEGDLDLARAIVSDLERQAPGNLEVLYWRAHVELVAGAYWRAKEAAEKVLKIKADHSRAQGVRSKAIELIRQEAEALGPADKKTPP
jgi:tetratricopeptide (TPR) repeat protein/tRNA A-37 threonylcarbamoyl transferase component Bud32